MWCREMGIPKRNAIFSCYTKAFTLWVGWSNGSLIPPVMVDISDDLFVVYRRLAFRCFPLEIGHRWVPILHLFTPTLLYVSAPSKHLLNRKSIQPKEIHQNHCILDGSPRWTRLLSVRPSRLMLVSAPQPTILLPPGKSSVPNLSWLLLGGTQSVSTWVRLHTQNLDAPFCCRCNVTTG